MLMPKALPLFRLFSSVNAFVLGLCQKSLAEQFVFFGQIIIGMLL
jgi:hypothetical protein